MAVITYLGTEYTVDHAVKGADFIHGYDENSVMIVSFEGINDFSGFSYNGTYMEPEHCLAEGCNDVKYVEGALKKADGTPLLPADIGAFSVIDARTGIDMDDVLKSGSHYGVYRVGENTDGTPAKYNKSSYNYGLIISHGTSSNGFQIAFISGAAYPFYRYLRGGEITEWFELFTENNPPTLTQLGAAGKSTVVTASLAVASWEGAAAPYTYTLSVEGVTATSNQEILPGLNITSAQLKALQAANIQDGGQAVGKITLKAFGTKPTIALPIRVIKRGDA